MANAPVCPISRDQAVSGMPARKLPPLPRVSDLPSAIAVLNELANLIQNPGVNSGMSNGYSQAESVSVPDNSERPKQDDGGGPKKKKRWDEIDRGLEQVKYENPDDKDIFVLIPRIYRLEYEEIKTMVGWDWDLGADSMS
jgi:hypothetical protein